jgi:hypothetical protein
MATGVEINGGGNNKVSKSSFYLSEDSKAVVINDSEGNEVSEILVVVQENIEKLKQIQSEVLAINDYSINPKTDNTFKDDVLTRIPVLINAKDETTITATCLMLFNLLSSWITVKSELAIQLTEYRQFITSLVGG